MNPKKTPMPKQDPLVRNHNFEETTPGYADEIVMEEAQRYLQCKHKPCINGRPVNIRVPGFVRCITEEDSEQAYHVITSTSSLPTVCDRVYPQETQCEAKCARGIKHELVGIGHLERYVADWYMDSHERKLMKIEQNRHKIAIIGAGPADLICAGGLNAVGYSVTVFKALHTASSMLMYGIPQFRLPKEIVQKGIGLLKSNGVAIETDMVIGRVLSVDELFEAGLETVFIDSSAGLPSFMNIPDEGLVGVHSANGFLTRINLMKACKGGYGTPIVRPKNIAVCGDGNVAMDATRNAGRLGAGNVHIVYHRVEEQMPAHREEIHHTKKEEIDFRLLTNPVVIHDNENGRVTEIKCIRMELGEPDMGGRHRPVEVRGPNSRLSVDCVVMAIDNSPNPLLWRTTEGLEINCHGCLIVNGEVLQTTREGVFAGGDAVTGATTATLAMDEGKHAVNSIDEYIENEK